MLPRLKKIKLRLVSVKLVALRSGLCDLISKEIIDLDFAIDLFNTEHDTNIMKRLQEEKEANQQIGV